MKKTIILILAFLCAALPLSAQKLTRNEQAHKDWAEREKIARMPGFSKLKGSMTSDELEAMTFLYAYMPLPDIADNSADFFLENVRSSLRTAEEMSWGKIIPEREFRHFVLPVRVNNENLDNSRIIFFDELKDRVKGLTMEEAILEVNHWCHEKVTYQPSDSRTSSPLITVRNALGRCGEESTFTVAALRSVGIPARQIYTPRWAHTDDNHAWVEAWANGKWYYIGACEPEAILNLAWFNEPASRGMLMRTRVFGKYDGPEEVLQTNPLFTDINITENYAPTGVVNVKVTDKDGKPVENAYVEFCLYNYAEFYTIASRKTDAAGKASLLTGLGDIFLRASKDGRFGFTKGNASQGETVIILDKDNTFTGTFEFDIIPPAASATLPKPTAAQAAACDLRKMKEDSIRKAYEATFATADDAKALAAKINVEAKTIAPLLINSRGNHGVIENFLRSLTADNREKGIMLLQNVSEKDLHDITPEVLADNMSTPDNKSDLYGRYILSPRVEIEMLTPFRSFFNKTFTADDKQAFAADPRKWTSWVAANIATDTHWNPQGFRMSPEAVYECRMADPLSKSIFFVAGARTFGIPARIDPVTGKTQFADGTGKWIDVEFENPETEVSVPKSIIKPHFTTTGHIDDPKYYSQFTIATLKNGRPTTLGFNEFASLSEMGNAIEVDAGQYELITGQRLANGGVLARIDIFNATENKTVELPVIIRQDTTALQVIGSFNAENLYHDTATDTDKSVLSTTGRGFYILCFVAPNHEPSAHALNDISAARASLDKSGLPIMVILPSQEAYSRFDRSLYPNMPTKTYFGSDIDGKIADELRRELRLGERDMPIIVIADTFNRIVFSTSGYGVGLDSKLAEAIHKLR